MAEKNPGKEGGDLMEDLTLAQGLDLHTHGPGFLDSRRLEETIEGGWTIWILLLPGVPAVRSQLGQVHALQGPHPRKSMNCLFRERPQGNVISDFVL